MNLGNKTKDQVDHGLSFIIRKTVIFDRQILIENKFENKFRFYFLPFTVKNNRRSKLISNHNFLFYLNQCMAISPKPDAPCTLLTHQLVTPFQAALTNSLL